MVIKNVSEGSPAEAGTFSVLDFPVKKVALVRSYDKIIDLSSIAGLGVIFVSTSIFFILLAILRSKVKVSLNILSFPSSLL
jgi:hypothetical protein